MTMSKSQINAVILAGGSGSRLWPMSRQNLPKQFLALDGDATLLQTTINRLSPTIEAKDVKLGWEPKTTFEELVKEMVREDLKTAERDELVKSHGYYTNTYHE